MLTDPPSEHFQKRSMPDFDRPLRRMLWIIPASLCLWILLLAGFALMLGKTGDAPSIAPLEVSLADFGHGAAGGSPGGGAGTGNGGGGPKSNSVVASPHPLAAPALTKAAPPAIDPVVTSRPAPLVSSRPAPAVVDIRTIATKTIPHRTRRPKRIIAIDEDALDRLTPAPHRSAARDNGLIETALRRPDRELVALPATPPAGLERSNPARQTASPGTGSPSLSAGGVSDGEGGAGNGSGSRGTGSGGGIGNGSQAYTTVEHPPVPVSRVIPVYPGNARTQGVEGEVVLRAIVDQRGAVERDIVVVESIPVLDQAAIAALRQWRFEPGRDAGNRAVRVLIEVPLRFQLQ
jgi:protein TonB